MPRYAKAIPVAIVMQLLVSLNVVLAGPITSSSPELISRSLPPIQVSSDIVGSAANPNGNKCPEICILDGKNLCDALKKSEECPTGIPLEQWNSCKNAWASKNPGASPTGSKGSSTVDPGFSSGEAGTGHIGAGLTGSKSGPWSGNPGQTGSSSGGQAGVPLKASDSSDSLTVKLGESSDGRHSSVPIAPSSGGAVRPPTASNPGDSTSSIPGSGIGIEVDQDSHPSGSTGKPSGSTIVSSTGVLSGIDGLGSKGSSGSGVVSPSLGGLKGSGAKDGKGEDCGCDDGILL